MLCSTDAIWYPLLLSAFFAHLQPRCVLSSADQAMTPRSLQHAIPSPPNSCSRRPSQLGFVADSSRIQTDPALSYFGCQEPIASSASSSQPPDYHLHLNPMQKL